MACATTRCRGVPSASYTVALSKEPDRPDIRNTSPPAPLAAYASTMSSSLGLFALVPARGCPPQLLTSALRSEASGRVLEVAFAEEGSVPKLESMQKAESRTTTSPPRTERVAVATTLPPTTSSSLASGRPSVAIVVALSAASTLPSSRFDPSSSSLSSL